MRSLNFGWTWNGETFEFSKEAADKDREEGISHIEWTTREITKAMCDMTNFLRFTGEDSTMFDDQTLPTLDTALWVKDGKVLHKFFEKPMVGNQVLNRNTALPLPSLRASLLQETVRRLLNCSLELDVKVKQDILSKYSKKLINSGHSLKSARIILVQGVVKFLWKVKLSSLPVDDLRFRPLHQSKSYCEEERQICKFRARMNWFKTVPSLNSNERSNNDWRKELKGVWKGSNNSQRPVLKQGYSTVLNVPNTRDAILTERLIKSENNLARLSNYNVKIVERSGIQLNRLFKRVFSPNKCHWPDCPV